jgi:hypothetical protein
MSNAGYQKTKNISKAYEMYPALLQDFMLDLKMAVNPKTDATIAKTWKRLSSPRSNPTTAVLTATSSKASAKIHNLEMSLGITCS